MSRVSLTELLECPGLVPWLISGAWKDNFEPRELVANGFTVPGLRILDPDSEDYNPDDSEEYDLVIGGEVREPSGRRHRSLLSFSFDDESEQLPVWCTNECSCPQQEFCRHAAATFEALASIASTATPSQRAVRNPDIDNWLFRIRSVEKELSTVSKQPKPGRVYNKVLAYCIELQPVPSHQQRTAGGTRLVFTMRQASTGRNGGINVEATHATADPTNPPQYMADEDMAICSHIHARKHRFSVWGAEMPLAGPGWEPILGPAAATGRLFFSRQSSDYRSSRIYQPLTEGPPVSIDAGWETFRDGSARPILKLPKEDMVIASTKPLRYIDFDDLTFGLIQSETPPEILEVWTSGPTIPAERIPDLNVELRNIPTAQPLPTPAEKPAQILSGLTPLPILHVTEVLVGVFQKRHLGGILKFQYPGCPVMFPAAPDAPPQTSWMNGENRVILQRNMEDEERLRRQLYDHGLEPLSGFYPARDLNDKNRYSIILKGLTDSATDWLRFLDSPPADALKDLGWTIESDPKLGLTIHNVEDFFPAIQNDPDHGIDWFRFDVTGEFNGKHVSFIPQIARAIAEDWVQKFRDQTESPETLLIPCDNPADGHIRFPAKRFIEMVEQVRHLFHGASGGDGPLRMDRLSAAGVADALAIASDDTTRALAKLGSNLRDIHGLPPATLPATIKAELRGYQLDGFRWLQFLATHGLHGILADDMGLGKTLQTLSHLVALAENHPGEPSLVVAPTSVVPNWAAEAEKFAPHLKVLVLHGNQRLGSFDQISKSDIVLTSYPLLVRDFDFLETQQWRAVVLDEAQYIKNPKALSAHCACKLKAAHRICLSGTPMENHLGELWSLMRFLMPGFLADEKTFNAVIRKPIERDKSPEAQIALNRRVSPLILRRTKDQVATELPEKTTLVHGIDLTPKQTDLYESVRAAMDNRVREAIATKGIGQSHIIVLDALLKLRQICCHPQLLKTEAAQRVLESAKLEFLTTELLPQLLEEGRKILIFSQFTSMLELIEEHIRLEQIPYLKLTGQTKERADLVKRFQSGEIPIFLISLKAGGTGLNLTAADTVIHYDPWWNPAAENQATDRAHRIGQTKPVFVHKLVCRGTIEDRILDLQAHKAALVEALLSDDTAKLKIDAETLSHLLAPLS
jgi:hypothetical protein